MTKKVSVKSVSPMSSRAKSPNGNLLDDIHRKIQSSAALNGGFDTLLYKIDKIEQSQGQLASSQAQLVEKVDKIHDAIYEPDSGLFSKLSEFKLENTEKFGNVDQKLLDLSNWKTYKEKNETKEDVAIDEATSKIKDIEKSVDSLVRSKDHTWAVLKWVAVAISGGLVTLLFKWIEKTYLH